MDAEVTLTLQDILAVEDAAYALMGTGQIKRGMLLMARVQSWRFQAGLQMCDDDLTPAEMAEVHGV